MSRPVLLTLGHGYSAAALAASLGPGWRVIGTTRAPERAADMRAAGVEPVDWADAAAVDAAIAEASHVLVSLPPDASGDPALARHGAALAARGPAWVGYLSTTGVYGDRRGGWVNEESALRPGNARSQWRAAAEVAWLASGLEVEVFRLAGIYGPGRSAFDRLREGRAQRIVKAGQVFSRIHVEDIAGALGASITTPRPGTIWNVADDEPAPPEDVIAFAAELLGMPPPPEIPLAEADLSPMARSFYAEFEAGLERAAPRPAGRGAAPPRLPRRPAGDPRERRVGGAWVTAGRENDAATHRRWSFSTNARYDLGKPAGRAARQDEGRVHGETARGRSGGGAVDGHGVGRGAGLADEGRDAAAQPQPLRRHRPDRHALRAVAA